MFITTVELSMFEEYESVFMSFYPQGLAHKYNE